MLKNIESTSTINLSTYTLANVHGTTHRNGLEGFRENLGKLGRFGKFRKIEEKGKVKGKRGLWELIAYYRRPQDPIGGECERREIIGILFPN